MSKELRSNTMTEEEWTELEKLTFKDFEPCPFCSEQKAFLMLDVTHKKINPTMNNSKYASPFYVECSNCLARGGQDLDPYKAIEKWNNRC